MTTENTQALTDANNAWFRLVMEIGEKVGCLASSYPDGNAHILRVLDALAASRAASGADDFETRAELAEQELVSEERDFLREQLREARAASSAPTAEAAYSMGAKGGQADEAERLAFEEWMRGHCWALCATWNGREYRSDAEQGSNVCPHAMRTRQLWAAWRDRAALSTPPAPQPQAPIDMVLHCPACGKQHIDAPEPSGLFEANGDHVMLWENPPHRSHLCHDCGHVWRPADVDTNGVAAVKTRGKKDSPVVSPAPQPQGVPVVTPAMREAGARAAREYMERTGGNDPEVIFRAMLAAAPQPPANTAVAAGAKYRSWLDGHHLRFETAVPVGIADRGDGGYIVTHSGWR